VIPDAWTRSDSISNDALYPVSFDASAPMSGASDYFQDSSLRLLAAFFRDKGVEALKQEDRQEAWYQDWIDYQAKHGLYASLLSPERYSSRGHRLDIGKLARFVEAFGYFSPAHGYSLHVSLLGLFPILMSGNEGLKKEAIAKLEEGGLFAFAVSEKAHGSDLFANQFTINPATAPPLGPLGTGVSGEGRPGWIADGAKYYIGNANAACLMSVFAKKGDAESAGVSKRQPFVFFALRPSEAPALRNVAKIRTLGVRSAFVGSFDVRGHTFPDTDLISQGRAAWDAVRATVNFGKFFLGFGAVGICEHAFAEAIAHMSRRILFGKPLTAMPHIQDMLVRAFARLCAMKLYAYRALDYLQVAGDADRRYLLWSAVQKAKVSTEGVKVMSLLAECIGARAFEADTYFETALRDMQLIPSLEGSTHINFALTAQFLGPYFADSGSDVPRTPPLIDANAGENPYCLGARNRIARTVRFADYLRAYEPLRTLANVRSFVKQVEAFRLFANGIAVVNTAPGGPANRPPDLADPALYIAVGKCLATIAYAQLVAENCMAADLAPATASVIFHGLIADLTGEALALSERFPSGGAASAQLKAVLRIPERVPADVQAVAEFIGERYRD
jgi:acyl-CoA dehydrogenase